MKSRLLSACVVIALFVLIRSVSEEFSATAVAGNPQQAPKISNYYAVADTWQLPLDGQWTPLTQKFNVWNSSWGGYHLGQDITRDSEVPVYAAANAHVKFSAPVSGYGNVVIIEHQLSDSSYFVASQL
jgi:murein DD-endopeptidase MepM/ murein hydrolase activator NlpD